MSYHTVDLSCPRCGAAVGINTKVCEWCNSPIVICSFNSVENMGIPELRKYVGTYKKVLDGDPDNPILNNSIAFCYLRLNLYDQALEAFESAIENNFNNSETYFYAAVSILKGKKAFLAKKTDIERIIRYIEAANMIEERGIYHYFLAYIKYDYYERKGLRISPDYKKCLVNAGRHGLTEYDRKTLFDILKVEKPREL